MLSRLVLLAEMTVSGNPEVDHVAALSSEVYAQTLLPVHDQQNMENNFHFYQLTPYVKRIHQLIIVREMSLPAYQPIEFLVVCLNSNQPSNLWLLFIGLLWSHQEFV